MQAVLTRLALLKIVTIPNIAVQVKGALVILKFTGNRPEMKAIQSEGYRQEKRAGTSHQGGENESPIVHTALVCYA